MSEPKGAIPKLFVFITMLILGILFNVPDEANIGVMILEAFAKAISPFNNQQANQMIANYILLIKVLGIVLFIVGTLEIYVLFRRRQYFDE